MGGCIERLGDNGEGEARKLIGGAKDIVRYVTDCGHEQVATWHLARASHGIAELTSSISQRLSGYFMIPSATLSVFCIR